MILLAHSLEFQYNIYVTTYFSDSYAGLCESGQGE